jgi:leader peptidase (prepilin peptidase)/N-methyltransferase
LILGLEFGSFANVCIYRWPRGKSILKPIRSHCPWCNVTIPWFDNVPVISYFNLRSKCRNCHTHISFKYPFIELTVAIIWSLFFLVFQNEKIKISFEFYFFIGLFLLLLVIISSVDLEWKVIPDQASLTLILSGLVFSFFNPFMAGVGYLEKFYSSILGAASGFGVLYVVIASGKWFFKKEVMGLGDAKLLCGIGAFLGFKDILSTLFYASLLGGLVSIVGLSMGWLKRRQYIPFGPFISIGALVVLFLKRI